MVLSGKLYAPPHYHRALRAQLAAKYSGASVENVEYCPGVSPLPNGLEILPDDAAPLFHGADGVALFDANAIAYYLGNEQLRGGVHGHFVTQWGNFTDQILMPSIAAWFYPILGVTNYNKHQVHKAEENIKKALTFLNNFLSLNTYFVGERITQADLTIFSALKTLFENLLDETNRQQYPHVSRWYTTIANQPEVKEVIGEMKLCEKPLAFDPKEKKSKRAENNHPPPKKQEPKQKIEKPKNTENDDDIDEPPPKPSKNLIAHLPEGSFIYDDFKKVFCNEDLDKVVIPFFLEKFDPSTDSIWYCKYLYPEELKQIFMSANLIRGMFQRLEKMQKFSFAIMNLYGKANDSTIGGIWIWRGTDLIFELSPDLQCDYSSFEWKKCDFNDPKTKSLIADYFARGDTCENKSVAETFVFK